MKKKIMIVAASLVLTGALVAGISQSTQAASSTQQPEKKVVTDGDKCPDFSYSNVSGKVFTLKDFKGKYIYIDVWATWCGPCQGEIPHLQELEKKMEGKKIAFVSISVDKEETIEAWKKQAATLGGVQLNIGGDSAFMVAFGIRGIPRFILIDPKGNVVLANAPRPSSGEEILKLLNSQPGI